MSLGRTGRWRCSFYRSDDHAYDNEYDQSNASTASAPAASIANARCGAISIEVWPYQSDHEVRPGCRKSDPCPTKLTFLQPPPSAETQEQLLSLQLRYPQHRISISMLPLRQMISEIQASIRPCSWWPIPGSPAPAGVAYQYWPYIRSSCCSAAIPVEYHGEMSKNVMISFERHVESHVYI